MEKCKLNYSRVTKESLLLRVAVGIIFNIKPYYSCKIFKLTLLTHYGLECCLVNLLPYRSVSQN